ncbi:MAG: ABC transporter substrate-binding protein, partial [Flavobacteriales bacterium]
TNSAVLQEISWNFNPIHSLGCLSTTHIPYLKALHCDNLIVATGFSEARHHPEIESAIQSERIFNVLAGGTLDKELLLKSSPKLFFTYPFGGNSCQDLLNAGMGCVQVTEYLEEHPLGRAEWIKLFGALLNRAGLADTIFQGIEQRYKDASTISQQNAPLVFFGTFDGEAYYSPPGNSFIAQLIRDAGARYFFEDRKGTSNIRLDKEEMMEVTTKVDFMGTIEFGKNEWLKNIQSISSHEMPVLFSCDAASRDYYGEAILQPEVLLLDFKLIFQGGVIPPDSLKYFELCQ